MNNIEEVIKVTDEKILEISNYIHNADISATEKAKRRLELSCTLFVASIAMNSEEIAKENLAYHLLLLMNAAKETIETNFHGGEPNGFKITKMKEYKEENDEYRDKSNDLLMEVTDYVQNADISYREKTEKNR